MKQFLHIGCGPIQIESTETARWLNADKEDNVGPGIVVDFSRAVARMFRESEWDGLFSCHCLEHCEWPRGVERFLTNALYVLKPGGTMRLVVPDLMKVAKMYVRGEALKDVYGPDFPIVGPDCPATRFMAFCRGWEHTVLFDENLLRMLMEQAGFVNIRVMPFGVSRENEMCNLDRFESESLSMEGQKP